MRSHTVASGAFSSRNSRLGNSLTNPARREIHQHSRKREAELRSGWKRTFHGFRIFFAPEASDFNNLLAGAPDDGEELISNPLIAPHPLDVGTAFQELVAYCRDDQCVDSEKREIVGESLFYDVRHLRIRIQDANGVKV